MLELEKTITLKKPIALKAENGVELPPITELALREPNGGELEKATRFDTSVGVTIELISLITGKPRKLIEKLSHRDLKAASDFFDQMSKDGAETETDG